MGGLKRFGVYAVEDTAVQLSWGDLGPGRHRLAVGRREVVHEGAGPGTAVVDGLLPATTHDVSVDGRAVGAATTLPTPPGALLTRIATVSDCHLFEESFGVVKRQSEQDAVEHVTARCLRAALGAAKEWGAELVVVKGDITQRAQEEELAEATRLLAATGLPVIVIPGNHEVKRGSLAWAPPFAAVGCTVVDRSAGAGVTARDLPGIRIVAADTTVRGHHAGSLEGAVREAVIAAVSEADRPVLLCVHHQLQPARMRLHYPPGIPHVEAMSFLDELASIRPDLWVTNGHTHRCRARRHGTVVATEVGSTKDGAGCWAGYAVHEGGIRQVLRRVTGDGTDAWLDRTGRAVGGLWRHYSPGRLEDRCISHTWPTPPSDPPGPRSAG